MPRYEYACGSCQISEDHVRRMEDRDQGPPCPRCGNPMKRDVVASMAPHTVLDYDKPILSRALGVNPEQIPEAQQRFPDHKFLPDGRMVIKSHQEHKRILKDLGFTEY